MIGSYLLIPLLGMTGFNFYAAADWQDPMTTKQCKTSSPIKEIRFLEKFVDDLKANKKRATTRRGIRCVRSGSKLKAVTPDGKKELGVLMVTQATVLRFNEIDQRLATAENTTVEGLQKGLIEIYGPEIKDQDLTAVYFIWMPTFSLGQ